MLFCSTWVDQKSSMSTSPNISQPNIYRIYSHEYVSFLDMR